MDLKRLEECLTGEPAFRLKQAKRAVFVDLVDGWNEATTLSLPLREKLNQECPLDINAEISNSGETKKALLTLDDGLKVETVLLAHEDGRNTVCVSSQVGCAMGCLFCATGQMGFKRNLTSDEIIEQVLFFARELKKNPLSPLSHGGEKVTNIVFMGMGEPLFNYDNVMAAIKFINSKEGFEIGARHISLSTIGVPGGIRKFASEPLQINLAVSIHAPNNELRSEIIPYNNYYSLEKLIKDIGYYIGKSGRKVMVEYMMIKGLNDSPEQAAELSELFAGLDPKLYFVNLIIHNPIGRYKPATTESVKEFKKELEKNGISVTERYRFGRDINAACGQLATNQQIKNK